MKPTKSEPRRSRRIVDDDHIFMLWCMEECGFKPDFQLLGEKTNRTKDALRMRFNRLKARINAGEASRSANTTEQATGQEPELCEEKKDICHATSAEPVIEETILGKDESPDMKA